MSSGSLGKDKASCHRNQNRRGLDRRFNWGIPQVNNILRAPTRRWCRAPRVGPPPGGFRNESKHRFRASARASRPEDWFVGCTKPMRTRARRVCAVGRRESRAIAAEVVSVKRAEPARRARGQMNETRNLNDRSSSASGYDDVWCSFRALRGELGGARGARHPRFRARPSAVFKPQAVRRRSARTTSNNTHDVISYIKSNNVRARTGRRRLAPGRAHRNRHFAKVTLNVNFKPHRLRSTRGDLSGARRRRGRASLAQTPHLRPIWHIFPLEAALHSPPPRVNRELSGFVGARRVKRGGRARVISASACSPATRTAVSRSPTPSSYGEVLSFSSPVKHNMPNPAS